MQKGMTLVEVLVASLIMLIIVVGVLFSLNNYHRIVIDVNHNYIADNIANEFMEKIREMHVVPAYTNPVVVKDLFGVAREYQVTITDSSGIKVLNTGQLVVPKLNKVTIGIDWEGRNVSYSAYYEK